MCKCEVIDNTLARKRVQMSGLRMSSYSRDCTLGALVDVTNGERSRAAQTQLCAPNALLTLFLQSAGDDR